MATTIHSPWLIRFGAFEINVAKGELRKRGIALKLHPQPFRVLLLLVENSGQIVTREQIRACLWNGNTYVDFERGINFCINQIRKALADDAERPEFIETLPKQGYRFIAAVSGTLGVGAKVHELMMGRIHRLSRRDFMACASRWKRPAPAYISAFDRLAASVVA
jgi:DNA-binding winged helix-turn-helix (wHTH) protein